MNDDIKRLVAQLLIHEEADMRRQAAEELTNHESLIAVAALAVAVKDENKGVRDAASRSLSIVGGPRVAQAIVEYLGERNMGTRNFAADLLIKLNKDSIPALLPYLDHPDQDVRKFAVDILGVIGSDEPASYVISKLTDPDENVVISAVEALGNMKSELAIESMRRLYVESPYTRATIAEALGKIGDTRTAAFLLDHLKSAIEQAASDPLLPYTIFESLGAIGTPSSIVKIYDYLPGTKGKLRLIAIIALIRIAERTRSKRPSLAPYKADLLKGLDEKELLVKQCCAKALSEFEDREITEAFIKILGIDEELDTQVLALLQPRGQALPAAIDMLRSVQTISVKRVVSLITAIVVDLTRHFQSLDTAESVLLLYRQAFDVIAEKWETSDEETRSAIVDALFHLDGDRVEQFIDRIMDTPDPWLRMHVIEVLGEIMDPRLPEFIGKFLKDEDEMVREAAMMMLQTKGYSVPI
jgi:HEAT repeat protein